MKSRSSMIRNAIVSLFLLNSLFLLIYFSFHSSAPDPNPHIHSNPFISALNHVTTQKPWPILPSYLPWTSPEQKPVPYRSCEACFGNGFNRHVEILRRSNGSSWFQCFYSETLRSSICEGGNLRMVPERIKMSKGGERLEDVMGRGEEEEMPEFLEGSVEVVVAEERLGLGFKKGSGGGDRRRRRQQVVSEKLLDRYVPDGDIQRHSMRELIASIRAVDSKDFVCEEWVEEPTLLVTRFEYANLFHTVTDWYSAYVSSRVTGLPNRPHVVFVDGHCQTQLEETWQALFSGMRYAKNFSGPVCFRHAVLSPLGYETALFKGLSEEINCYGASAHDLWQNPDDGKTARLSEFGEMIRAAFGLPVNRHRAEKAASSGLNVLFVRREDYLAHPRHGGKVESRLTNEQEVFDSLQSWLSNSNHSECKVNLVNGLFAHMPMKDQVRAIQDASVIIGAHGAGLTHIVAATPKTVIYEIISSQFRRPHFALIAQWKGLEYHAINLDGSYADPRVVIDGLNAILKSLGC